MIDSNAKFAVGQIIQHKLFSYRGVIVDVDANFQGSEAWYENMALTHPPKDQPWYTILVDGSEHKTYVAERNMELDTIADPVQHPEIGYFFKGYKGGKYQQRSIIN